jgi:cytochrome oxidase assembly protein ShyY1
MGGMVARLLVPRWLGLHLLAATLVATFVVLGLWQLGRAQAFLGSSAHPDPAAVALTTLSGPAGALPADAAGRRVVVTGVYDAAHGFDVPGRTDGAGSARTGVWVVGLLRLADGSGVCILRGWTAGSTPPAAPGGTVVVSGRLEPSEPADGGLPPGHLLPAGQLAAVNPVDLLATVPYPVHDGYVVASGQQPADPAGLAAVRAAGPGQTVPGFFLQHVGYVGLWWLFAVFVAAFWVRLVRDELAADPVVVRAAATPRGVPGSGQRGRSG